MKKVPMILLLIAPYAIVFLCDQTGLDFSIGLWIYGALLAFNMVYAFLLPRLGLRVKQILFWNLLLKLWNIPLALMILLVTLVTSLVGGEGIRDEASSMVLIALLVCYLIQVSSAMFGISGFRWCRKYGTLSKAGMPVSIRFLDPPLHEFVPTTEEDIAALAATQGKTVQQIKDIITSLHEFNPMMGHRSCRLSVTYPEIAKMQTSAVIRAAINVQKAHPEWNMVPEIMIPLVGDVKELKYVKKVVVETANAEIAAAGVELKYEVRTMIEIPRACLTADEIAQNADFFCFGTNDLTQMTYGFSRNDAGKFLNAYYDSKIFENDPFAKLDQTGVGKLMNMACTLGRANNAKLHIGICGEHGGDPTSVEFCHKLGLDYVSCSPFRVPIARLAAAQAAIGG